MNANEFVAAVWAGAMQALAEVKDGLTKLSPGSSDIASRKFADAISGLDDEKRRAILDYFDIVANGAIAGILANIDGSSAVIDNSPELLLIEKESKTVLSGDLCEIFMEMLERKEKPDCEFSHWPSTPQLISPTKQACPEEGQG